MRTVAAALRRSGHGDRVILAANDEPYRESISLSRRNSGDARYPFTIIGNGAILDGSGPLDGVNWEPGPEGSYRFQPWHKGSQLLFLDGRPLAAAKLGAALDELQWRYHASHIYFRPAKDRLPVDYPLARASLPVGITLYQVKHVEISDLTVQGFRLDGINAHDSAFSVTLAGVTARANGRSGFSIGGASRLELVQCTAQENGQAQVRTEGWSHSRLIACTLVEDSSPALLKEEHSEVEVVGMAAQP
jgi:hypothetical protein